MTRLTGGVRDSGPMSPGGDDSMDRHLISATISAEKEELERAHRILSKQFELTRIQMVKKKK